MIPQTLCDFSQAMGTLSKYSAFIQSMLTLGLIIFTAGLWQVTKNMAASTKILADENQRRGEDAKRPKILAKLKPMAESGHFIQLVLNNAGPGVALNVRFRLEGDEEDFSRHEMHLRGTSAPINFVSPGESEVYEMGAMRTLGPSSVGSPMKPFSVLIEYEDIDGNPHEKRIVLNVMQFGGLYWSGSSVAWRQMSALEKIEKHLGQRK